MVDTQETVASKQSRYLRLMQKAKQLDDQLLVRLIRQKLTINTRSGYTSTTDKRGIIQFPGTQVSAQTFDCEPLMFESSNLKLKKSGSKLLTLYYLAVIVFFFMFVFLVRFYNPDFFQ